MPESPRRYQNPRTSAGKLPQAPLSRDDRAGNILQDPGFVDAHSTLRALATGCIGSSGLSACGGGGGDSSRQRRTSAPPRPVEQSDLQIAQSVYGWSAHTRGLLLRPAAERLRLRFDDAREERQCRCNCRCPRAALRAVHRLEPGARVVRAQRTARAAVFRPGRDQRRSALFEFGRVREAIRRSTCARVFKCAYLDRSDANLRDSAGPAGQLNRRRSQPPSCAT